MRPKPAHELALAVVACAVGAGLAYAAATSSWSVGTGALPGAPGYEPQRELTAGPAWLPALGYVALAGAGALVATRGAGRRIVGVLVLLCGLGLVVVGSAPLFVGAQPSPAAGRLAPTGLAAGIVAGVLVAAAGAAAAWRGRDWPGLGARFQRPNQATPAGASASQMWDAMDRGEDPTDRPVQR